MDYPTEKQVSLLCYKLREWGSLIPSRVRKGCDQKWSDIYDALGTISRREIGTLITMAGAASSNGVEPKTLLSRIQEIQETYRSEKKCGTCKNAYNSCHCD